MVKIRPLTLNDVEISVLCIPEDEPYEDYYSEHELDTKAFIAAELAKGNDWAWCAVRVVVRWKKFECEEYIGACSHQDEAQFRAVGEYDIMVEDALIKLNDDIANIFATLTERIKAA